MSVAEERDPLYSLSSDQLYTEGNTRRMSQGKIIISNKSLLINYCLVGSHIKYREEKYFISSNLKK